MATLLVSDTSVLIDLRRGRVLEAIFRLSFEIGVPDVLFKREIKNWDGPPLRELGLKILELDGPGVAQAQSYRTTERRISLPVAFALALAKAGGHILLAGDASLRALADREGVECHGVLWVIDQLEEQLVVGISELAAALNSMVSHPRCRLPRDEVQRRLIRYRRGAVED